MHAVLYYTKYKQYYGNFAVYRLLIKELRILEEEGIEDEVQKFEFKIYFKLGLFIGDNLGLHGLLEFVESFNANFSCRFCKMNIFQRSVATVEDPVYLRTKHGYEKDILRYNVSSTGIKEGCVFN